MLSETAIGQRTFREVKIEMGKKAEQFSPEPGTNYYIKKINLIIHDSTRFPRKRHIHNPISMTKTTFPRIS
jgi:hypothetical protein